MSVTHPQLNKKNRQSFDCLFAFHLLCSNVIDVVGSASGKVYPDRLYIVHRQGGYIAREGREHVNIGCSVSIAIDVCEIALAPLIAGTKLQGDIL